MPVSAADLDLCRTRVRGKEYRGVPNARPARHESGRRPGPGARELERAYPDAVFAGPKFGEELARYYADADVFVFPSFTDTFGLVILEALATGTPVAAFVAPGPKDLLPGSGAGICDTDLKVACMEALKLSREAARAYAEKFSWRACAEEFRRNLQPLPQPEKKRFWKRLRNIRLRSIKLRRKKRAESEAQTNQQT